MKHRGTKKYPTQAQLDAQIELLARQQVSLWIEQGMIAAEMQDRAVLRVLDYQAFLARDIRTFAETGKYPEFVAA